MPAISVVIPVYNVEDYLEESLNSILNQTSKTLKLSASMMDLQTTP